jgi:FixJ family two-component response regulator
MPGMSGPQFVQALTVQAPHMRVLFTSGYTDGAIVNHGHLKPGLRFLPKPFSTSDLIRGVRQAIDDPLPNA